MAIALVPKTSGSNPLQVRILHPPPRGAGRILPPPPLEYNRPPGGGRLGLVGLIFRSC